MFRLVRDYISVMPTNCLAPGLYDLQDDVFYGNVGTGQFLTGKSTVVDSVTLRCLRKLPSGLTVIIK